jgi:hypothetical protein
VCIRGTLNGPREGQVVAKNDEAAKRWPEAFAPVNPNRLAPGEALRAKATMERTGSDGRTRVVHIGQWVHRDDELVIVNPESFEAVTA